MSLSYVLYVMIGLEVYEYLKFCDVIPFIFVLIVLKLVLINQGNGYIETRFLYTSSLLSDY